MPQALVHHVHHPSPITGGYVDNEWRLPCDNEEPVVENCCGDNKQPAVVGVIRWGYHKQIPLFPERRETFKKKTLNRHNCVLCLYNIASKMESFAKYKAMPHNSSTVILTKWRISPSLGHMYDLIATEADIPKDPFRIISIGLCVAAAAGDHSQLRATKALHEGVGPLLLLQQTSVGPFPQSHHQVHQSDTQRSRSWSLLV